MPGWKIELELIVIGNGLEFSVVPEHLNLAAGNADRVPVGVEVGSMAVDPTKIPHGPGARTNRWLIGRR